jgi:hypothetical protein
VYESSGNAWANADSIAQGDDVFAIFTGGGSIIGRAVVNSGTRIVGSVLGRRASGLGDLTRAEVAQIQSVVNQTGHPLSVVGSAARGTRGPGSDIDYTTSVFSRPYFDELQDQLPGIAPHGVLEGSIEYGKAFIRFDPLWGAQMKLRRFWFKFETFERPTSLNLGCGVTAYGIDDAKALILADVFDGEYIPRILEITEDVDVRTLEENHVRPNMGNVVIRGVWFPLGHEHFKR